ncbi:hypothetical protein BS78_01G401800 [Paspalum vaginatum]|nr:hypothetical protein BS78_01G401800 [Paspalum vaginatum]
MVALAWVSRSLGREQKGTGGRADEALEQRLVSLSMDRRDGSIWGSGGDKTKASDRPFPGTFGISSVLCFCSLWQNPHPKGRAATSCGLRTRARRSIILFPFSCYSATILLASCTVLRHGCEFHRNKEIDNGRSGDFVVS